MAIDFPKETIIAIRKVPEWCEANIGRRVHPSTVNRWHRRGSRSVRLETLLVGGSRAVSYTHLRAPRDQRGSRMPSSA